MRDADRFDRWFKSLPLAKQAELRKGGVIPYDEMPIDDNVFPVVEDHKMWSTPVEEDRQESTSFMSEEIVRERLAALLGVLEKFSDRQMRLHLRFIRAMLGTGECETLAKLSKDFGITKQAMTWRARQVRAALGRLAVDAVQSKIDTQNTYENNDRQKREGSVVRLRQMESKVRKESRCTKSLRSSKVSSCEREKASTCKGMARTKQIKTRIKQSKLD